MKYELTKIDGSSWRPGMPKEGWIVRYNSSDFGWLCQRTFATEEEAKAFADTLTA